MSENGLRVVRGDGMTWPRTAHRPSGYLRLIHMLEVAVIPTGSKRWKASGHFSDLSLHHICCCPIGQHKSMAKPRIRAGGDNPRTWTQEKNYCDQLKKIQSMNNDKYSLFHMCFGSDIVHLIQPPNEEVVKIMFLWII